jgi:hypothetical protein
MTDEEIAECQRVAIMQWSLILLDEYMKDRPADIEWCARDLLNAE